MPRVGETQYKIFKWMQDHPLYCQNQTLKALGGYIADDIDHTENGVVQAIYKSLKSGTILSEYADAKQYRRNFRLNYLSPLMPKDILANAPSHQQDTVNDTQEKLKSGEYLDVDQYGAGITKRAERLEPEPVWVEAPELEDVPLPEPMELLPPEPPVEPQPVEVEVQKDGKAISIHLTINLNL